MKFFSKWRILSFVLVLVFLAFWEILAQSAYMLNPQKAIPPLSMVFAKFIELCEDGILGAAVVDSLGRFFAGLLIGGALGSGVGLLLGRFRAIEILLEPFTKIFAPISPIAWLPIIVLWLGIGNLGAIFIIAYAVFFPTLALSIAGVRSINPTLLAMAKNFGASEWQKFRDIILPGAFVHIASGLKLAASVAWIQLVAAEMLGIQSGLGYLVADGRNLLELDMVIVAMLWIGLLGYGIALLFGAVEKLLLRALGVQS